MKLHKLFTILLLGAVILSACGPAATPAEEVHETTAPPAEATAVPPTEEPAVEAKPVVVSVWTSDLKAVQLAAEAYTAETGKPVTVQEIARDVLQEKEKTELTSKTGAIDILYVPSEWLAELAEGGLVEPLDEYMANPELLQPDQSDWASPGSVDAYRYKDSLYGFPVSMDTLFLYYRKDLIETPPETWDDFLRIAQEQTTAERYGTTIFGKLPESISWDFINYFWGFGGELLDENFHPTVNSEEGVAALTFFTDLLNKYQVVPPGVPTYEYPEVLAAFQQDKAAMVIQWNAAYQSFVDPEQSPLIYDKFETTVLPGMKMDDGTIYRRSIGHVWGFVMNASSTNKEEAYNFLVYLTSKEGLKFFPDNADSKNVNSKAILNDPAMLEAHPEYAYLADSFQYMSLWPTTLATSQLILTLAQEASAALAQTKSPQEAMDDAQQAIDELMQEAGYY
ncbi:MAG: sugar ABC transporter substrate-binding protein [Anaerolineae bacterium]|nr:sugar ABC transporter substrate-binding protein [Anaerolineae bacterium]